LQTETGGIEPPVRLHCVAQVARTRGRRGNASAAPVHEPYG